MWDDRKLKGEVTRLMESTDNAEGCLDNPLDYKNDLYEELSDDIE